jgi:hypothetical protein
VRHDRLLETRRVGTSRFHRRARARASARPCGCARCGDGTSQRWCGLTATNRVMMLCWRSTRTWPSYSSWRARRAWVRAGQLCRSLDSLCLFLSAGVGSDGSATVVAIRSTAGRRFWLSGPPQWLGSTQSRAARAARGAGDHWRFRNRCVVHPGSCGRAAFSVVFAAMGLTHPDAAAVRDILEDRAAAGELALFLNTADDPVIERRSHHG